MPSTPETRDVRRRDLLRRLAAGPLLAAPATGALLALGACAALPASAVAQAAATTVADARLLEAIDWYTGTAGRVDDERARALLLEAAGADGADPDRAALSHMWIARVHSRGRMGFEADEERARAMAAGLIGRIRDLAVAGDVEAAFLMGTAYDEALGVAEDPAEAARWYRGAARRGHVLAAHNLGNVSLAGRGVEPSAEAAVAWWLRAAHRDDAIAQLRLGESFERGRGVPADLGRARHWYGRAAALGNAQARDSLATLGGD